MAVAAAPRPRRVHTDPARPLIEQLVFKKDHRCFKKGRKLSFRTGVNLLVGEQGCGKSSALRLVRLLSGNITGIPGALNESASAREIVDADGQECKLVYCDFESENPRVHTTFDYGHVGFQLASKFKSHGEIVRFQGNDLLRALKDVRTPMLLLLDEPDTALSPRSAHELAHAFAVAAEDGHQLVASVHNPIIIASQPHVYSLEHKRWMRSEAFLGAHAEAAAAAAVISHL